MKFLTYNLLIIIIFFSYTNIAKSNELPTLGLVYNTQETFSLSYNCKNLSKNSIECDFIQTFVRQKSTAKDLIKNLQNIDIEYKNFSNDIVESDKTCSMIKASINSLKGKISLEEASKSKGITDKKKFIETMKSYSEEKKKDLINTLNPLLAFCKTPSKKNYENMIKSSHEKDLKTCRVGSFKFTQKFTLIGEPQSKNRTWVVDSKASGPCGVIQLSRFEPEFIKIEDSEYIHWNYIAKKAVTNPNGDAILLECSVLDENEYKYSWRSEEYLKNCKYIEFSNF